MENLSEDLLETLNAMSVICHWSSYHGTHCRRTIQQPGKGTKVTLCPLHQELVVDYKRFCSDEGIFCDTSKKIKFTPRSYKHLKYQLDKLNNHNVNLDVIIKGTVGELTEEADISNNEYIEVLADEEKYYYKPEKGQKKVRDLTVILREYCQHNAVIEARGENYCEECYRKLKNVPKISVVPKN